MKRIDVELTKDIKKETLTDKIIAYMIKHKKPILVSDLYAVFPEYSDRNIRTIIFKLTKQGKIDDSHKCECQITRMVRYVG